MTTSHSPLRKLKAQADKIAATIKATERGENLVPDPAGKLSDARGKEGITFGVVMDDKVLKITMAWSVIKTMSEASISEYILRHMRGAREAVH